MAKILIIEDEADVIKMLRKRLADNGYETLTADNAGEGMKLVLSDKPDMILLDLKLPAGGGLSILRSLKMSAETRDIPVIVITGMKKEEVKNFAMREGAAGYIEKPYDPQVLMATIRTILQKRTGAA